MDFGDVVRTATLTSAQDRLRLTDNPPYLPVAWMGQQGIEIGAYCLQMVSVEGDGESLTMITPLSRWWCDDPVNDFHGPLRYMPNLTSVWIEWGDGMTDRPNMPFDQPTRHDYEPGDYLMTATLELDLNGYPQHLAAAVPAATYLFHARA